MTERFKPKEKDMEAGKNEIVATMFSEMGAKERVERAEAIVYGISSLMVMAHGQSARSGFYDGAPFNLAEKIALIHSELSEALEFARRGPINETMSEKIPDFTGVEEELADVLIRVGDLAAALDLDLDRAVLAKMSYNASRAYKHGKKF